MQLSTFSKRCWWWGSKMNKNQIKICIYEDNGSYNYRTLESYITQAAPTDTRIYLMTDSFATETAMTVIRLDGRLMFYGLIYLGRPLLSTCQSPLTEPPPPRLSQICHGTSILLLYFWNKSFVSASGFAQVPLCL